LLFLFRCNQMDQDLAEEMQFHIEMKAQEKLQAGMGEKEAEQAAKREFGNALLVKEVSREPWGFLSIESFLQEIRFGLRMLRKNPGFTTGAILTFALGIGANTAMFSIVDGVLLKPLPYANPEQLVQLTETWNAGDGNGPPSWPDFLDWRDRLCSFSGLLGYSFSSTFFGRSDGSSQGLAAPKGGKRSTFLCARLRMITPTRTKGAMAISPLCRNILPEITGRNCSRCSPQLAWYC
jgi:hypothetical protein